ncbi:MAG: hypothetical protein V1704_00265 [Candidatus Vogelbacteria bacterium]
MKKIILLIVVVLIILFFFIPVRKVVTGCEMFGVPEKTEILTAYQAFKQGYLQIPNPDNYWTFKTEPLSSCM